MGKINWIFKNETTGNTFTTSVLSANYMYLRQSYKDYYSGANLVITIKNQSNEAAGFSLNDLIFLYFEDSSGDDIWVQNFYVNEIEFEDYPGNTGLSTATIICQDWLARAARVLGGGISLPAGNSLDQLDYFSNGFGFTGPLPPGMTIDGGIGVSQCPAVVWNDSVINKIQINQLTENASVGMVYQRLEMYQRSSIGLSNKKFGPNVAANTVVYQTFKRIRAGQNLINYEEVNSTLGTVTATDATSTTAYGKYAESVTSADSTLTQQTGLAEFRANTQGDPLLTRFELTVLDIANDRDILDQTIRAYKGFITPINNLVYRVPGAASDTTVKVKMEGINVSMTPSNTVFTFYFSPAQYYTMFILDSADFGILDTDRLGW
jgi:hypothetical protein